MSAGKKILLLEDEESLNRNIRLNLEAEGFEVFAYKEAESAISELDSLGDVSLGVLDIMLPGDIDGLEFCRRIRAANRNFPVIFLTAKNRLEDKLEGFDAGADDYLTKPFDLEELLARVHVQLRNRVPVENVQAGGTRIGAFELDLEAGQARGDGSKELIRFNKREAEILRLLFKHRGQPVSRDMILDQVWGTAEFPTNRTIDNYMVKFRKIFEPDPQNPVLIITRHGIGYEIAIED